jgi:urea transport system permease protein
VPQVGIINPGEFSPVNSIEIVIWVAVGGRATLIGAVLGALLVNYAKTRFTAIMPEAWLFALGALFVLVTLYLPNGLMGLKAQLIDRKTKRAQLKASSLSVPSDSQEKVI